ncbi:LPS export ABC transporter periplasmic protein LptC [Pasteurella atlantica]|uniref:LPS export ABC transporter periplasmic protein LptC n=3 Tax=Pasteurellaceae TaxID=712 RepID=A0ACC6HKL9_9PAST|nr:LPS export ABC transporter periplasmic protein LptC [Pasteurella atlantica]MBR0572984.1 LPS export ABC transporter periplasmic protein LptC [Pasteurella atlantica]MDP8033128.1 LPS export ABC transporter periplasmic protein LptC [Pasteurella atlantica]MDP8035065.1 LPS export ABC transporter periplasmic protein LptC [Pasteurella atlantica]MDP8036975.1 LPS export ABC transporter periplasmic protein LptC [Pasteurella atlantica]MDP8038889.1 LPS export ABC transporter periplasmic protein LptC [Pa
MNLRLNIVLVIVVSVLAGWYFSLQQEGQDLERLIKRDGQPEYVGDKITTEVYDVEGKPQYFAQADEIKHYETTGRVELVNPLLNLFDTVKALKEWKLTSDEAEITKNKILQLRGNVKIQNLNPLSKLQQIEAEILFVNLKNHDIFSDSVVSARGIGFNSTGTGLQGNLKKQSAKFQKDVKTHIEPTKVNERN